MPAHDGRRLDAVTRPFSVARALAGTIRMTDSRARAHIENVPGNTQSSNAVIVT
jgi:hypothetical protein